MELNRNQREAFLNELEKAHEDRNLQYKCREKSLKEGDTIMVDWFDMSIYLTDERIKLIKKSLTDNQIDY